MKFFIIPGAGAAGLAAASRLIRSRLFDVTILEASNRIGGRVHSSLVFGSSNGYVELGAQWIHGEIGNIAFKLAKESELVDLNEKKKVEKFLVSNESCKLNGKNRQELETIFEQIWNDIMENSDDPKRDVFITRKLKEYCNRLLEITNYSGGQNQSFGAYIDVKFNELRQK